MKKLILLFGILAFFTFHAKAQISVWDFQNNELSAGTHLLPYSANYEAYNFYFKNDGTETSNFVVEVTASQTPESATPQDDPNGIDIMFCVGNCFFVDNASELPMEIAVISIEAGDTWGEQGNANDENADIIYLNNGVTEHAYITFRIYKQDNPQISATVTLDNTATNVTQISTAPLLYPNPSSDFVWVSSDVQFDEIRITNTAGQLVKISSENRISVADLDNGLYFYSILHKNSKPETGKFIVSK